MGKFGEPSEWGYVLKCPYCKHVHPEYWCADEFLGELRRGEVEGDMVKCPNCGRIFRESPGLYIKATKKEYDNVGYES